MKSDISGRSTCPAGEEQYEGFMNGRKEYVQYDYREPGGRLFSCVKKTLEACRDARDGWLAKGMPA